MIQNNYTTVPESLKDKQRWVYWMREKRGGKVSKIPYAVPVEIPCVPRRASPTDPGDWVDYPAAIAFYNAVVAQGAPIGGLGFVFGEGDATIGVDIDDCLNADGSVKGWAKPFVDALASVTYGEISPSGTGIKFIGRWPGKLPGGRKVAVGDGAIEVYQVGRYFTITGQAYGDRLDVGDLNGEVDAILELFPAPPEATATVNAPPPVGDDRRRAYERCERYLATMPPAIEGQDGSGATFRAAAMVARFGLEGHDAMALMQSYNARCEPPWSDREIEKKLADARKDVLAKGEFGKMITEHTTVARHDTEGVDLSQFETGVTTLPAPTNIPSHLLHVPGFVADVMAYNLRTAKRPQPDLALAGAIALQAAIIGRKVKDAYGNRANLQIISIAKSGWGKDHARAVNRRILSAGGCAEIGGPEDVTSDTALYRALAANPAMLWQCDEFGRFLAGTNSAQSNPHLYGLPTALMKLFTSADQNDYLAKAYADPKFNIVLQQPYLVLHATTTPQAYYGSLSLSAMNDGFLGRCLEFEASGELIRQMTPEEPVPSSIVDAVGYWRDFQPVKGNLGDIYPHPMVVEATREALGIFDSLGERCVAHAIEGGKFAGLWTRAEEKAWKLALVYACSADREQPAIDVAAATWACDVTRHITARMVEVADVWVSEGQHESDLNRIRRELTEAGGEMIKRDITRATRALGKKRRDSALDELVESGLVVVGSGGKGGKAVVYRLAR